MKLLMTLFALVWLSAGIFSLQASTNDAARYLAGLNVDGSELEPLAREQAWQDHAVEFQRAWLDVEQRQLGPIRAWMPATLGYIHADPAPLFYMFSGPDMLSAATSNGVPATARRASVFFST